MQTLSEPYLSAWKTINDLINGRQYCSLQYHVRLSDEPGALERLHRLIQEVPLEGVHVAPRLAVVGSDNAHDVKVTIDEATLNNVSTWANDGTIAPKEMELVNKAFIVPLHEHQGSLVVTGYKTPASDQENDTLEHAFATLRNQFPGQHIRYDRGSFTLPYELFNEIFEFKHSTKDEEVIVPLTANDTSPPQGGEKIQITTSQPQTFTPYHPYLCIKINEKPRPEGKGLRQLECDVLCPQTYSNEIFQALEPAHPHFIGENGMRKTTLPFPAVLPFLRSLNLAEDKKNMTHIMESQVITPFPLAPQTEGRAYYMPQSCYVTPYTKQSLERFQEKTSNKGILAIVEHEGSVGILIDERSREQFRDAFDNGLFREEAPTTNVSEPVDFGKEGPVVSLDRFRKR